MSCFLTRFWNFVPYFYDAILYWFCLILNNLIIILKINKSLQKQNFYQTLASFPTGHGIEPETLSTRSESFPTELTSRVQPIIFHSLEHFTKWYKYKLTLWLVQIILELTCWMRFYILHIRAFYPFFALYCLNSSDDDCVLIARVFEFLCALCLLDFLFLKKNFHHKVEDGPHGLPLFTTQSGEKDDGPSPTYSWCIYCAYLYVMISNDFEYRFLTN